MTDEIGQSKGDSGASCDRQTVQGVSTASVNQGVRRRACNIASGNCHRRTRALRAATAHTNSRSRPEGLGIKLLASQVSDRAERCAMLLSAVTRKLCGRMKLTVTVDSGYCTRGQGYLFVVEGASTGRRLLVWST
jgi:hypothetical protein